MLFKKILPIAAAIVALIICFTVPSLAWSYELVDGWTNVTEIDKVTIDWPVSSMGAPSVYTDVQIPGFIGPVTANMDGLLTDIQISFEGNYVLGDIIIPDGYKFKLEFITEIYTGLGSRDGWASADDFNNQYCQFYDNSFSLYKADMDAYNDGRFNVLLTCDFDNLTDKDLYLNNIVYDLGQLQFLEYEMFDVGLHKIRFVMEKLDLTDTDLITGAINSSTNTITNGWVSKPKPPAQQEQVDEVGDLEDQIMGSVSGGEQDVSTVFNSAISQFSAFLPAFAVIGRVFSGFVDIPLVSALLHISLSLGVCAFTLNLTSFISSSIGRHEQRAAENKRNREAAKAENDRYQRWLFNHYEPKR